MKIHACKQQYVELIVEVLVVDEVNDVFLDLVSTDMNEEKVFLIKTILKIKNLVLFRRNSTFDNLMNDYYQKEEEEKLFADFDMMVIDV